MLTDSNIFPLSIVAYFFAFVNHKTPIPCKKSF